MGEHLSESDWERIRKFAETPAYDRSPEILSDATERTEETSDRVHGGDETE